MDMRVFAPHLIHFLLGFGIVGIGAHKNIIIMILKFFHRIGQCMRNNIRFVPAGQ